MFKKVFFRTLYVLTLLIVIVNTAFAVNDSLSPDINDLPEGTLCASYPSPDGYARIDIYSVSCDLGSGVKGVYVTGNENKNIFWQTGKTTAYVRWIDGSNAVIDNVALDIKNEVFDSRFGTAIFSEGILRRRNKK